MSDASKRSKGKSAGDLMQELQSDSEFVARRREREAVRDELEQRLRREERPLIADLARAGVKVESVWDLVNTAKPYPEAIATLTAHLNRDYSDRIQEGIARALTVKEARRPDVGAALIAGFRASRDVTTLGAKWALANALCVVAGEDALETVAALALDRAHGESRRPLVALLGNFDDPRARSALAHLVNDPEVSDEAHAALGQEKRT